MPQLAWDELDFLECLGVIPDVLDEVISHSYSVPKDGLVLLVTVWQLESVARFSILREGSDWPLCDLACYVRGRVRRVNDDRGDYLEFQDCVVAPDRFWYIEAKDPFDRHRFPVGVSIEVGARPDLRVRVVPCQS